MTQIFDIPVHKVRAQINFTSTICSTISALLCQLRLDFAVLSTGAAQSHRRQLRASTVNNHSICLLHATGRGTAPQQSALLHGQQSEYADCGGLPFPPKKTRHNRGKTILEGTSAIAYVHHSCRVTLVSSLGVCTHAGKLNGAWQKRMLPATPVNNQPVSSHQAHINPINAAFQPAVQSIAMHAPALWQLLKRAGVHQGDGQRDQDNLVSQSPEQDTSLQTTPSMQHQPMHVDREVALFPSGFLGHNKRKNIVKGSPATFNAWASAPAQKAPRAP